MKIRNGFVSNSSSSSFIVALNKKPESAQEVMSILDLPEYISPYQDQVLPAERVAGLVFDDIQSYEHNEEDLAKLFSEVLYSYCPSEYSRGNETMALKLLNEDAVELWETYVKESKDQRSAEKWVSLPEGEKKEKFRDEWHASNDRQDKMQNDLGAIAAKEFLRKNKDKFIFCVEYEDHSPEGTIMEHGEIFRNVTHFRISHHYPSSCPPQPIIP
jgi:hypothetical protein